MAPWIALWVALIGTEWMPNAAAWQWTRPFGAFPGFDARDGGCTFSFFNNSDQTFRIGIFGGTTVKDATDSSARRAFNDVWFSPPVSNWVTTGGKVAPRKGVWVQAEPLREESSSPGVPGSRIGPWPEARWDHQCVVFNGDPGLSWEGETVARVNRTENTTNEISRVESFTLFVMGGQRSGKRAFFGEASAWNMTVADMSAAVPSVIWRRVNTTLRGDAWSPRYGHCALHMRVKGYWQRTLNKARIQSPEDSFEVRLAKATPSDLARVYTDIEERRKEDLLLGEHGVDAITGVTILLGGLTVYGFRGDVWLSTDRGMSWERRNHRAFSGRFFHGCEPIGESAIIVMGGRSGGSDSSLSDVHRSDDFGLSWKKVLSNAGWEKRYRFSTAAFIASHSAIAASAASVTSAVAGLGRSQPDAASVVPPAAVLDPAGHVVMLFGGYSSGDSIFYADAWATNDGIHWTKQTLDAPLLRKWTGRSGHTCLFIPGTIDMRSTQAKDNWNSGQEVQIRQMPALVMIAGRDKAERLSDVWVRQGPVILTNAAAEQAYLRHYLRSYLFLFTLSVTLLLQAL